ncbi:CBO0543 family protein [Paenibacillus radicis (ex Xue et al. 2023)]|uniref:Uncharacterized protein n=1 Tax=Paenibacillus radicis (ex Xue et al. 2023) TaxID=2972489 RepID=A0ABT1YN67_9BACL|nr:CBO0543 family protein [Paenibacillus radicis (ex Xue et al. 2023)]MCR8633733.1 hypothetical protein [Paenibacillus radicis (ex Xue et al. 2023)]
MRDINRLLEAAVWVVSALLLLFFVPKKKYREAWISFFIMQLPTWLLGLFVVQLGLIEYPSRFMADGTNTSFTYEFFALPVISIIYNLHYPSDRGAGLRLGYVLLYASVLTGMEIIIEAYTDLVEYIHWNWLYTWVSVLLTLQGSYWFYVWFTKGAGKVKPL